jgi:hypothetical protein
LRAVNKIVEGAGGSDVDSGLEAELAQTIRAAAPRMVAEVIKKALEGSYLHTKFLFDLASIELTKSEADAEEDESLAAFLLKELSESRRLDSQTAREG